MDWLQVLILVITIIVGNISLVLPLWLWSRSESRNDHRHLEASVTTIIEAIRQDMKDFHCRLAVQDAEFKHGMLLLEEKLRMRKV